MRSQLILFGLLGLSLAACSSQAGAPRDPGNPTPVGDPRSGPASVRGEGSTPPTTRRPDPRGVPQRPDQAPLVQVQDVLEADSLLGRRVRVRGRCTARGQGRRAGSWILDQAGSSIEVRGLVPYPCAEQGGEELVIFAQIEPKAAGGQDRLLLRLPD